VIAACNAASEGNIDVIKKLYKQGIDFNIGDYDNRTPLHIACASSRLDIVGFLLDVAKVKVSPVDRWGATPLNDALKHLEIKQLMLDHGAVLGKMQPPY
jgi:glutaminase